MKVDGTRSFLVESSPLLTRIKGVVPCIPQSGVVNKTRAFPAEPLGPDPVQGSASPGSASFEGL